MWEQYRKSETSRWLSEVRFQFNAVCPGVALAQCLAVSEWVSSLTVWFVLVL